MDKLSYYPNNDFVIKADNKAMYNLPATRRKGFRDLHYKQRYSFSLRSDLISNLEHDIDSRIGQCDEVFRLTQTEHFCAMVVVKNQKLIFEKYSKDFQKESLHTIMSISKMTANLIVGELVAKGLIDLNEPVKTYLPGIGSGYAEASIQQVLNMDVENNYSEDYEDPYCSSFEYEAAMGWRFPPDGEKETTVKNFLRQIKASGKSLINNSEFALYKSANTDILGWVAEVVSGRSLRSWILDIVEATGIENSWTVTTDRNGFPILSGGISSSARDLARFGQLFCRCGSGIGGRSVGDKKFIKQTIKEPGKQAKSFLPDIYYSNQTFCSQDWLGHPGYGGQFLLANIDTGISIAFFSVLENRSAVQSSYQIDFIKMLANVSRGF